MQSDPQGTSGFEASIVGLETWVTGGGEIRESPDDDRPIKAIRAALDRPVPLIGTAPSCGSGHSEEVVCEAVRSRRDHLFFARAGSARAR